MDSTKLRYIAETKADKKSRSLTVTISTKNPDRSRDVVMPRGVKMDNYLKNPVVAFAHDYRGLAIAKTEGLDIMDDRIVATVLFPDEGVYPLADQIYGLYKGGFMNAWSIGFMPLKALDLENGGKQFDEWELLEFSAVLVGDNPEALTMLRSKGIDMKTLPDFVDVMETKTVIPYRDLGTSDPAVPWDGSAEVSDAEVSDLKLMSTWFDAENPEIKTSYKLPHHKAAGGHPAVLRGVYAAMGALLGARGGVNIPDSDKRGVYNHLAKHYAQYDVEPPEFRSYEKDEIEKLFGGYSKEIDMLKDIIDDSIDEPDKKSGRVLSAKNRGLLKQVISQMGSITDAMKNLTLSMQELLDASDQNSEPDKTVIDLAEGLKIADKAIGLALRKLKEARS